MTIGTKTRRRLSAAGLALMLAACGGGHHYDPGPPPVAGLGLTLTRIGPDALQLDWSYDPVAVVYDVVRDGYPLAQVGSTTLVDASVFGGYRYCYQVTGRGASGAVVSVSSVGCITAF